MTESINESVNQLMTRLFMTGSVKKCTSQDVGS